MITLNNRDLIIISLYKPLTVSISEAEWNTFFSQFDTDILIGGDFNAHHVVWGNVNSCSEGIKLYQEATNHGLTCMNNGILDILLRTDEVLR